MNLAIITAFDENQVIGLNNQLPWHLPQDLTHFKKMTSQHSIIMGRKTFESIGKPLPNRDNIVISSRLSPQKGITIIRHPEELHHLAISSPAFIIGGEKIYEYFLPLASELHITQIKKAFTGDTFFPKLNLDNWQLVSQSDDMTSPDHTFKFNFTHYTRKPVL